MDAFVVGIYTQRACNTVSGQPLGGDTSLFVLDKRRLCSLCTFEVYAAFEQCMRSKGQKELAVYVLKQRDQFRKLEKFCISSVIPPPRLLHLTMQTEKYSRAYKLTYSCASSCRRGT